jgi:DNA gyrase inhibitor GyrI
MDELNVRIERLEPMRIASVQAIGESPEPEAWQKLRAWAEPRGLLEDIEQHPVFGFNNPPPDPDREGYGYEFWIKVDADSQRVGEISIKDYEGGLYAVTTCKLLGDAEGEIPEVWMKLLDWVNRSKYTWRKTHELEKTHDPMVPIEEIVLDLYLPIEE